MTPKQKQHTAHLDAYSGQCAWILSEAKRLRDQRLTIKTALALSELYARSHQLEREWCASGFYQK